MNLRDQRQSEFAEKYIKSSGKGILNLCPRFGKIRTSINIFKNFKNPKILIAYPDVKIRTSWQEEFKLLKYKNPNIHYSTHLSLKKHIGIVYDIVVIDEIHLLSENQIDSVKKIMRNNDKILGLTGTLSSFTEKTLSKELKINVIASYSIDDAIKEGVISDYRITVKLVDLDNTTKIKYKTAIKTEKQQFDSYGFIIKKLEDEKKETFYLRLGRMRLIQNSLAKIKETNELIKKFYNERILIFCGLIKTAEALDCPTFHNKIKDSSIFDKFCKGEGNHLAVVKMGNTGTTYKPLNKVVINYFDSNSENLAQKINRCMAMEYDNPSKMADIWIICSTEIVELRWLDKALEFFDKEKITYIK